MVQIKLTKSFNKLHLKYTKHNKSKTLAVEKALTLFVNNPSHPSLNVEKLTHTNTWSMRLNRSDRIFFTWINNETALLLEIGPHDMYRKV